MKIQIENIKIKNRMRKLNAEKVSELAESFSLLGQLEPITLANDGDKYTLLAGWHRLEAAKSLGWDEIKAEVFDGNEVECELAEIDENLMRNDLTILEQGEHLARRQELIGRNLGRYAKSNGSTELPLKTTAEIAKDIGLSETSAQRRMQVARNIVPEVKDAIRNTEIANSTTQLLQLARLAPEEQIEVINYLDEEKPLRNAIQERKKQIIEQVQKERRDIKEIAQAILYHENCMNFLNRFEDKSIDLLITDPPYSTDIKDLPEFLDTWLYRALNKVKDTGRAFICIGAYPIEIYTYLQYLLKTEWIVDNPLIWTYRNTLGQTPRMKYNLNYQLILHLYKDTSNPLDNRITNEMFSVQDINAPDGRLGDRFYKWQKPDLLAERLINHTTKEGDKIIDPFAGCGTFILKSSELNSLLMDAI
jgi:ParB family chromosome partitioning protein